MARARKYEKPKNIGKTLNFLWRYMKSQRAALLTVALLVTASAVANVYGTYLLKPIINNYILPGDIPGLIRILIFMGAVYLAGVAATYCYTQVMVKVAQKTIQEIRDALFQKVQTLPLSFFDSKTHGELMSRFTNDIDTIAEALNNSFTVLIHSLVVIIGTFTVLIALNALLSVIVILSFLGIFLFIRYTGKKSQAYFSHQQEYMGRLSGFMEACPHSFLCNHMASKCHCDFAALPNL